MREFEMTAEWMVLVAGKLLQTSLHFTDQIQKAIGIVKVSASASTVARQLV
jgi:hypothetical protein